MRPAATEGWKQLAVPVLVGRTCVNARVVPGDHGADRFPDELKRLPVAAGGKRIATLPVTVPVVGVPVAGADALDQLHGDAVALDRQRVIGVAPIQVVNEGEVGFGVFRQAGCGRKRSNDRLAHRLPQRMQPIDDRRVCPGQGAKGMRRLERVGFANVMTRALHDGDDFTRDVTAADAAECTGQPAGNHRMARVEKSAQKIGGIGNSGKDNVGLDRISRKAGFGNVDQSGFWRNQVQAIAFGQVRPGRHLPLPEVVERCTEGEPYGVVGALRRVDDELRRDDGVFRMEQQGLLRGQVPVGSESRRAIRRAEFPEGREPGGRVASRGVRAGCDQPTLHDLAQIAAPDQTFAMDAGQLAGAKDTSSALLELFEPCQRCGKFLARRSHGLWLSSKFVVSCCNKYILTYEDASIMTWYCT